MGVCACSGQLVGSPALFTLCKLGITDWKSGVRIGDTSKYLGFSSNHIMFCQEPEGFSRTRVPSCWLAGTKPSQFMHYQSIFCFKPHALFLSYFKLPSYCCFLRVCLMLMGTPTQNHTLFSHSSVILNANILHWIFETQFWNSVIFSSLTWH